MTSFLQPIPIFGDFRTKYIGQQENIFLVSFSKWHFEYYTASANLFHSIQKKADILKNLKNLATYMKTISIEK